VTEFGDAVGVGDFYGSIYNATPAHMDDVHAAIIENPDIEVITEQGGERRDATQFLADFSSKVILGFSHLRNIFNVPSSGADTKIRGHPTSMGNRIRWRAWMGR
jgi:hypothetical protein